MCLPLSLSAREWVSEAGPEEKGQETYLLSTPLAKSTVPDFRPYRPYFVPFSLTAYPLEESFSRLSFDFSPTSGQLDSALRFRLFSQLTAGVVFSKQWAVDAAAEFKWRVWSGEKTHLAFNVRIPLKGASEELTCVLSRQWESGSRGHLSLEFARAPYYYDRSRLTGVYEVPLSNRSVFSVSSTLSFTDFNWEQESSEFLTGFGYRTRLSSFLGFLAGLEAGPVVSGSRASGRIFINSSLFMEL
jgi:hypothetical protein